MLSATLNVICHAPMLSAITATSDYSGDRKEDLEVVLYFCIYSTCILLSSLKFQQYVA